MANKRKVSLGTTLEIVTRKEQQYAEACQIKNIEQDYLIGQKEICSREVYRSAEHYVQLVRNSKIIGVKITSY